MSSYQFFDVLWMNSKAVYLISKHTSIVLMVRINATSRRTKNTKDCQDSKVWYGVLSNPTDYLTQLKVTLKVSVLLWIVLIVKLMCTRYLTEFSSPESDHELPVDVEPTTNSEIGKVIKAVSTDSAPGIILNAIWNWHQGYTWKV